MEVVSYSRWFLNAGFIRLIQEGLLYLKAGGLLIQVVSNRFNCIDQKQKFILVWIDNNLSLA